MTDTPPAAETGPARRFLGVPFRAQTYKSTAYLALGFPFGLLSFVVVTTGLATGAGLAVTLAGIPLLLATVAAATALASVEAGLTRALLGVDASLPEAVVAVRDGTAFEGGAAAATKRFLAAPTTWTSLLLALLWFAFGLVGFVALSVLSTLVLATFGAPVAVLLSQDVTIVAGPYVADTLSESVLLAALGVPLTLVALHALNALAHAFGVATASLLGVGRTAAA